MKKEINQLDSQGRRHGLWESRRENGTLMWKEYYRHGKMHGPYEDFHMNGNPSWVGEYRNDRLYKLWLDHDSTGTRITQKWYYIDIK